MSDTPIVDFYHGKIPDSGDRFIGEIHGWDHGKLEYHHDFIQWLFPLRQPSPINPLAPTFDDNQIAIFKNDPELQKKMVTSFFLMLDFYGFEIEPGAELKVRKSQNWEERRGNWLRPRNHNFLRITRILTSLCLVGLNRYATSFFEALEKLTRSEEGKNISPESFTYWQKALSEK